MNVGTAPSWLVELHTLLPVCRQFLLSGNIHDLFLVPRIDAQNDAPAKLKSVRDALVELLDDEGIPSILVHDIAGGTEIARGEPDAVGALIGFDPVATGRPDSLTGLQALIGGCAAATEPVALVILGASRLVRNVTDLSNEEFMFYRSVDRCARRQRSPTVLPSDRNCLNPVIWVLDHERDVPHWFALANEYLRSIVLPMPDADDRRQMARRLVGRLQPQSATEAEEAVSSLSAQTAGLTLEAMNRVMAIHADQGLATTETEDAARSYRVGIVENPWRGDEVMRRLRAEIGAGPGEGIRSRVLGQDLAVARAIDILARSAAGLTAAQASASATRPRGVLFFAGPTGVGKTELAKSLTRMLFDDEQAYVRFDMSEFSAEHAADRLIGAPPGYVGFEAGGELTNAIRQRPFCVVLFDEVEKAHPRILDKFLQLLDDGRLTDGRGETVYFTEAVIIFTSNLGMYRDVDQTQPDGSVVRVRTLTADPHEVGHAEMAVRIEQAIREHFTVRIGRPELLNRIGDNIVVFDFVRPETGRRILEAMMDNIAERVRREHGIDLIIPVDTLAVLERETLSDEVLEMGGRGIGARLESVLINPLARALVATDQPPVDGAQVHLCEEGGQWHVTLR